MKPWGGTLASSQLLVLLYGGGGEVDLPLGAADLLSELLKKAAAF